MNKEMTNREWLESLSDDELAQMIYEDNFLCECCIFRNKDCAIGKDCAKGIAMWLRAEHKGD